MKLSKLCTTALILVGANLLLSQSALACNPAQGTGQCTWDGVNYGSYPDSANHRYGNNYDVNATAVYSSQPTYRTVCEMLDSSYQSCMRFSLPTGTLIFEEVINIKTSHPILQRFYYLHNSKVHSELLFDEQGEKHGIQKYYSQTGQRYAVVVYEHGKEISAEYDDNGKITKVTQQYTPSHTIEHRRIFVNGKQHGLETKQFFHKKKKKWVMLYKVNWVNNKKHGSEKFYSLVNDKGKTKLDKTIEWHNGVQVR